MSAVMMPARIDTAADVQIHFADIFEFVEILIAFHDRVRDGQRTRIRQSAKIAAKASDHVRQQIDIRAREAGLRRLLPQRKQIVFVNARTRSAA